MDHKGSLFVYTTLNQTSSQNSLHFAGRLMSILKAVVGSFLQFLKCSKNLRLFFLHSPLHRIVCIVDFHNLHCTQTMESIICIKIVFLVGSHWRKSSHEIYYLNKSKNFHKSFPTFSFEAKFRV